MQDGKKKLQLSANDLVAIKKLHIYLLPVRILVLFSVLALVGGGPNRYFYELPGQVFSGLLLIQTILERILQPPDMGGDRKDKGSLLLAFSALVVTVLASVVDWYWIRPHFSILPWDWRWVLIGGVLFAAGIAVRVAAIVTLGRFFTGSVRILEGQRVIQKGLYRLVRHPAYSGLLVGSVGLVTIFASVFGYACLLLVFLPGLMMRVRVEEQALMEEFGDEYRAYARRVKRLIPLVY